MVAWWERQLGAGRIKWRVPPEILAAAEAERVASRPAAAAATVDDPTVRKFQISDYDSAGVEIAELERVANHLFELWKHSLEHATSDAGARETRYMALRGKIDKMREAAEERLKKRRLYILRAEVDEQAAEVAEMLRQSHESMERRVLENCPSLTADQRAEVERAIRSARAQEQRAFAQMDCLKSDEQPIALAS